MVICVACFYDPKKYCSEKKWNRSQLGSRMLGTLRGLLLHLSTLKVGNVGVVQKWSSGTYSVPLHAISKQKKALNDVLWGVFSSLQTLLLHVHFFRLFAQAISLLIMVPNRAAVALRYPFVSVVRARGLDGFEVVLMQNSIDVVRETHGKQFSNSSLTYGGYVLFVDR